MTPIAILFFFYSIGIKWVAILRDVQKIRIPLRGVIHINNRLCPSVILNN